MVRPRIFVGSSREQLALAYAIQQEVEHSTEPTVWTQGIFEPSGTTMGSLLSATAACDAAIFVFSPDDLLRLRHHDHSVVRDNVVFELGLFIGRLGLNRVFFLTPRETELHLPTDLLGVTPATFDAHRSDGNLRAAVGPACQQILAQVHLALATPPARAKVPAEKATDSLSDEDATAILQAWLERTVLDVLTRPVAVADIEGQLRLSPGAVARSISEAVRKSGRPLRVSVNNGLTLQLTELKHNR
jgi:hypothetical protein